MAQELWIVALNALASLAALFFLTKLMGKKQVSQMNVFDYIVGITIGSIAAEMATDIEETPLRALCAMVIYALVALAMSLLTNRSVRAQRFIGGKPTVLFDKGRIFSKNLQMARIDMEEFLMYCRVNGYFDLSQVETVILEQNGAVSVLPRDDYRPLQPADADIAVYQQRPLANLIVNGRIMENNLQAAGYDRRWLMQKLRAQGYNDVRGIALALCDDEGNLAVYSQNNSSRNSGGGME